MIKPINKRELIYLACPYTHASPVIRLQRFEQATKAAAGLIRQGRIVFSPITMTHPIDIEMAGSENTLGSDFWVAFDEAFMDRCDVFVLLPLAGWQKSSGVMREIEYFQKAGKPLLVLDEHFALMPFETLPSNEQTKKHQRSVRR
jgi:nucleoside 2-deoxyribosyltransferase